MGAEFDAYDREYEQLVNASIGFSGLTVDFFTAAKARHLRRLFHERFDGTDARAILDIGCGVGGIHPMLSDLPASLTGVDVSERCLARAREVNAGVEYRAYDGATLPFDDGTFDLCFTICVMHHVPPARWPRFMSEMFRVTAAGGLAVVIEHNPFNPLTRVAVNRCEFDKDAVLLRAGAIAALARDAGFASVARRYFLLTPFGAPIFSRLDDAFGWIPLGAQYYVAAGKRAAVTNGDA